jgi:spore maturation protein CgeB
MIRAGFSPSVRLFEAAACGTPIISDTWNGIDTFLEPGREIVLAQNAADVIEVLEGWNEGQRSAMAEAARQRILAEHTASHRAASMERDLLEALKRLHQEDRLAMEVGT